MSQGIVLNSRPVAYRSRFHAAFNSVLGAAWRIVDSPVLIATPIAVGPVSPVGIDLVIFTSQMGPATFPMSAAWQDTKVFAVGEATAAAAREAGFRQVVDAGRDVVALRHRLTQTAFARGLYASAADVTATLDSEFEGRIKRIVTYQMVPAATLSTEFRGAGWERSPVIAPLFSRRSATILADLLEKAGVTKASANVTAIGISAEAVTEGPWRACDVAAEPTLTAVAACAKTVADRMDG